jgi:general secretion pathway protein D
LYDLNSAIKSNETYSDIKIIASPSLTTINHKKAEISVGERVPMISTLANQTSQSDQNNVIPHVKYEDIILKFSVEPHIKKNGMIYIDIEQENNEIGENIPIYNNFTQSAIKTKKIKTSVCILNNQTLIIGGLINEKIIKTEKRIPILSDLPILGHLFQDSNTIKRKSNLILMITPTIITNKECSKRNLILNKIIKH